MTEEERKLFARQLKVAIAENTLSEAELGRRVGVTKQAVSSWTSGKTSPHTKRLTKLAEVLGRPVSWFFSESQASGQDRVDLEDLCLKLKEATAIAERLLKRQGL